MKRNHTHTVGIVARRILLIVSWLWGAVAYAGGPVLPAVPTTCDYPTAPANIVLTKGTTAPGVTATYLLVDMASGVIVGANSSTPSFSNIPAGIYYAVAAQTSTTLVNATVGKLVSDVSDGMGCVVWSTTVGIKVCTTACDAASGPASLSFTASTPPASVTTTYILVNLATNTIAGISSTPAFSNIAAGEYAAMAIHTPTSPTLSVGDNLYNYVTSGSLSNCGSNFVSNSLFFKVCTCVTPSVGGTVAYAGGALCPTSNAGTVTLTGQTGAVVRWETSTNGGTSWASVGNAGKNTFTFFNAQNGQQYRAVVNSGTGCVDANSAPATISTSAGACSSASCDKTAGAISFGATPAVSGSQYGTQLVLTNASGQILYVSPLNSTSVTGVAAGDYLVYQATYDNTVSPAPTITTGISLSAIGGACVAISNQLAVQVCPPNPIVITGPANGTTVVIVNPPISGTTTANTSVTVTGGPGSTGGPCVTVSNASGVWTCLGITFPIGPASVTATDGITTATTNFTVIAPCTTPTVGGTATLSGGNTVTLCSPTNGGNINLTGQTGTVVRWETSTDGGTTFSPIAGTAGLTTYNFMNAANQQQYRAVVNNGGSCADATAVPVTITTSASACSTDCSYNAAVIMK